MRLALVSQPGLFADGLAALLQGLGDGVDVIQASPDQPLRGMGGFHLFVVDLDGLGNASAGIVRGLRSEVAAPIVAISTEVDQTRMSAVLSAGARAYITKAFGREQMLEVMRRALRDGPAPSGARERVGDLATSSRPSRSDAPYNLTPQEMQVLAHLCEGHTNLGIAKRLSVKESTVKVHVHSTYQKLGVQNRTQAARVGARLQAVRDIQLEHARNGGTLRDWLIPHMTDEAHRKGEVLFRKGDPGQALYYIHRGLIALQEIGEVAGEGELLGEIGIFAPEQARTCTACCQTDAKLFCLSAEQARRLYLENPQFAYHIVQLIAQRLTRERNTKGVQRIVR